MIFPFATDRALRRPTVVTLALVAVNLGVYITQEVAAAMQWDGVLATLWSALLTRENAGSWPIVGYAFLHGGLWHVGGNMLFLWTFGPNLEDRLGRGWFLLFYLAGAAVSGGLHIWIDGAPVIGASGAIAGITGAYMVLFPRTNIKAIFVLSFGVLMIPAVWIIGMQIVWDVVLRGFSSGGGVARLAHIGGYAYGASIAMLLLWLKVVPREPYDLFTIGRQAIRRRQFREVEFQRQRAAAAGATAAREDGPRASQRAKVLEALAAARLSDAMPLYLQLLREHGREAAVLPPALQRDMANALFQSGDHVNASTAYDILIEKYTHDAQTPMARLMIGLIHAQYLNDPVRAKREIKAAMPDLHEPQQIELAKSLLEDLG